MFTGLVETTGTFVGLAKGSGRAARLSLRVPDGFEPVAVGASVAVNGVCLTAVKTDAAALEMDVLEETLARTNLGGLKSGERVNLERSLTPSGELGGHFVTGHVDGTGSVLGRQRAGTDWVFEIGVEAALMRFIAPKGSIAIDGISLTVVEARDSSLTVHIIPHTFELTTLRDRDTGARVNVEVDVIARTVVNYLERTGRLPERSTLTKEFLAEHGFA